MFGQSGPGPFDLRWRMFGIPVRIQLSFWFFCALIGFHYLQRQEWTKFFAVVVAVLVSFLLKELGQVIIGRIFGVRGGIVLYAFGGGAVGDYASMRRWQRIVFYATGPAFSFALFGLAWWAPLVFNFAALGNGNLWRFAWIAQSVMKEINYLWALLHLLPIYPLDGGMVVRELCEAVLKRLGTILSLLISVVCAAGLAAWAGYVLWGRRAVPWWFGDPLFSLIFDSMLAIQSLLLLIQILREPRPNSEAASDADSTTPAEKRPEYDSYRPYDGGRYDDQERR